MYLLIAIELQRESEGATKTKMVWVDQRTIFFFSMTGMADFLVKKQRPPRNLTSLYRSDVIQVCPHVFHGQREGTDTRWHSDSRWSCIVIGRPCRHTAVSIIIIIIASPALCIPASWLFLVTIVSYNPYAPLQLCQ